MAEKLREAQVVAVEIWYVQPDTCDYRRAKLCLVVFQYLPEWRRNTAEQLVPGDGTQRIFFGKIRLQAAIDREQRSFLDAREGAIGLPGGGDKPKVVQDRLDCFGLGYQAGNRNNAIDVVTVGGVRQRYLVAARNHGDQAELVTGIEGDKPADGPGYQVKSVVGIGAAIVEPQRAYGLMPSRYAEGAQTYGQP